MSSNYLKFEIESLTIAEIWQKFMAGDLNLQPEYQRKLVWSKSAQASLIETILMGYPIPEIYLSYQIDPDGTQKIDVVDGQQRLTSITAFIQGEFTLENLDLSDIEKAGSDIAEEVKKYEGKKFDELPEILRRDFYGYRIPVRRLSNMKDEFVRSVFARVNRTNMVLNAQELRNALMPGLFLDFLKDCVSHQVNVNLNLFSETRKNRGGDLEFYSEVFSSCVFGLSNKRALLDERYDNLSANFEKHDGDAKRFLKVLDFINSSFYFWSGKTRWSNIVDMFTLQTVLFSMVDKIDSNNIAVESVSEVLFLFQRAVSIDKKRVDSELDISSDDFEDYQSLILSLSGLTNLSEEQLLGTVREYSSGIRSSSDLKARRSRDVALRQVLNGIVCTQNGSNI